jgi:hypothetical protein
MKNQPKVEVFSAGCPLCQDAVETVRRLARPGCEITVLDLHDPQVAQRARELGIARAPAVVIEGKLAACCAAGGVQEETLRAEGLGSPLSQL